MHFRHRQTDRRTGIMAKARDVYITSRAKNAATKVGWLDGLVSKASRIGDSVVGSSSPGRRAVE